MYILHLREKPKLNVSQRNEWLTKISWQFFERTFIEQWKFMVICIQIRNLKCLSTLNVCNVVKLCRIYNQHIHFNHKEKWESDILGMHSIDFTFFHLPFRIRILLLYRKPIGIEFYIVESYRTTYFEQTNKFEKYFFSYQTKIVYIKQALRARRGNLCNTVV